MAKRSMKSTGRKVKKVARKVAVKAKKAEKRVKRALVKAGVPKSQVNRVASNAKKSVKAAVRKQIHGAANMVERKVNKGTKALAKVKSL